MYLTLPLKTTQKAGTKWCLLREASLLLLLKFRVTDLNEPPNPKYLTLHKKPHNACALDMKDTEKMCANTFLREQTGLSKKQNRVAQFVICNGFSHEVLLGFLNVSICFMRKIRSV